MCDGHFARIFENFMDFPRELLVFEDCLDCQEFPRERSNFQSFQEWSPNSRSFPRLLEFQEPVETLYLWSGLAIPQCNWGLRIRILILISVNSKGIYECQLTVKFKETISRSILLYYCSLNFNGMFHTNWCIQGCFLLLDSILHHDKNIF